MGSVAVTGVDRLPESVYAQTIRAVELGRTAGCAHLRDHGCRCHRAHVEFSVAPDSEIRAALEQVEMLSLEAQMLILRAESDAWSELQMIANSQRVN